jgi:hypothetical protein
MKRTATSAQLQQSGPHGKKQRAVPLRPVLKRPPPVRDEKEPGDLKRARLAPAADVFRLDANDTWLAQRWERVIHQRQRQADDERKRKMFRTRAEISRDRQRDSARSVGDLRLRRLLTMLDSVKDFVRSDHQREFHDSMTQACLPHIYGESWEANRTRVLDMMGITRIQHEVLIMTPRRWGKTISVAMFVTCLMLCRPGIKIAIFSTGKRASGSLMDEIMKMVDRLGMRGRICKKNEEQLFLSAKNTNCGENSFGAKALQHAKDTSRLSSFPSSVNGKHYCHTHLRSHSHTRTGRYTHFKSHPYKQNSRDASAAHKHFTPSEWQNNQMTWISSFLDWRTLRSRWPMNLRLRSSRARRPQLQRPPLPPLPLLLRVISRPCCSCKPRESRC